MRISDWRSDVCSSDLYEQLGYDAASNVTSRRLRDGTSIAYSYDNLGRLKTKNLPGSEADVTYAYDLTGRATGVTQGPQTLSFVQDALGRSEEHTSELQSLMRSSYADFCLQKTKHMNKNKQSTTEMQ